MDGDCLTLYCQNEFVRDSLNNNSVLHVLQEVASAAEGQTVRVVLTVGGAPAPAGKKSAPGSPARSQNRLPKGPEPQPPAETAAPGDQTPPWEEPPAEKTPDKLDEVAAQGQQLENFKIK